MAQFHDSDWWDGELKRMLEEQQPEDLHLDYKDKRSLLPRGKGGGGIDKQKRANDVSKDVSSFLNSDGGVLIYGVPEDQGPDTTGGAPVPLTESDRIGFKQGELDKEAIEHLITSNIQPKPGPDLFQIMEVEYESRIVFIVEIAVGVGDVWQAKDKKYYKRFHYKAEAMEHYEINMVRDRDVTPNLKLVFGLDDNWEKEKRNNNCSEECVIRMGIRNESNSVAEAALVELGVLGGTTNSPRKSICSFSYIGYRRITIGNSRTENVDWYSSSWPVDGLYRPLFRTLEPVYILDFPFRINRMLWYPMPISAGFLCWRIQAPDMNPKTGMVNIITSNHGLKISLEEKDVGVEIVGEA